MVRRRPVPPEPSAAARPATACRGSSSLRRSPAARPQGRAYRRRPAAEPAQYERDGRRLARSLYGIHQLCQPRRRHPVRLVERNQQLGLRDRRCGVRAPCNHSNCALTAAPGRLAESVMSRFCRICRKTVVRLAAASRARASEASVSRFFGIRAAQAGKRGIRFHRATGRPGDRATGGGMALEPGQQHRLAVAPGAVEKRKFRVRPARAQRIEHPQQPILDSGPMAHHWRSFPDTGREGIVWQLCRHGRSLSELAVNGIILPHCRPRRSPVVNPMNSGFTDNVGLL